MTVASYNNDANCTILYRLEKEKKQVLATKFEKVRSTNEKEYQESLAKLKQNLDEKIKIIEKTHECRLKMTELKYDAEKLSIRQQFEVNWYNN